MGLVFIETEVTWSLSLRLGENELDIEMNIDKTVNSKHPGQNMDCRFQMSMLHREYLVLGQEE